MLQDRCLWLQADFLSQIFCLVYVLVRMFALTTDGDGRERDTPPGVEKKQGGTAHTCTGPPRRQTLIESA